MKGLLGPPNGISDVAVIDQAYHQEFVDGCMLTPFWLVRSNGVTRHSTETGKEINRRTLRFLDTLQDHLK